MFSISISFAESIPEEKVSWKDTTQAFVYKDDAWHEIIYEGEQILSERIVTPPDDGGIRMEDWTTLPLIDVMRQFSPDKELPEMIDFSDSEFLPTPGEQIDNSCIGFSFGYALRTYQEAKEQGYPVDDDPTKIFSPSFIYNQINDGVDEGAEMSRAGDLLKTIGAATLADFPYMPENFSQPSEEVLNKAYHHRIADYRLLYTNLDSMSYRIQKTKEILQQGNLPVIGVEIGLKWKYPFHMGNGITVITKEYHKNAAHAVVVVGYDDTIKTPDGYGAFKIMNSYGTQWGMKGFSYLSYSAFMDSCVLGVVCFDLPTPPSPKLDITTMVRIKSRFNHGGLCDMEIKDVTQKTVVQEKNMLIPTDGFFVYEWDGRNQNAEELPDGIYEVLFYSEGKKIHQEKILKSSKVRSLSWDLIQSLPDIQYHLKFVLNESSDLRIYRNDILSEKKSGQSLQDIIVDFSTGENIRIDID